MLYTPTSHGCEEFFEKNKTLGMYHYFCGVKNMVGYKFLKLLPNELLTHISPHFLKHIVLTSEDKRKSAVEPSIHTFLPVRENIYSRGA